MSKVTKRYCKSCQKETAHDQRLEFFDGEPAGMFTRIFVGIGTLGLHEFDKEKFFICQCCDLKTKKN
jgi:hypothetical protein